MLIHSRHAIFEMDDHNFVNVQSTRLRTLIPKTQVMNFGEKKIAPHLITASAKTQLCSLVNIDFDAEAEIGMRTHLVKQQENMNINRRQSFLRQSHNDVEGHGIAQLENTFSIGETLSVKSTAYWWLRHGLLFRVK